VTPALDFRTARAANAPRLYAWLEQQLGVDVLRGEHSDLGDRRRWKMLRSWRNGERAQARFANVDAILVHFGLDVSQVPAEIWAEPRWGHAAPAYGSARG
jgi:hypothetical protein